MRLSGAAAALLAAGLFGLSTPLAKLLLAGVSPWMLAGLLYLGSGFGLAAVFAGRRIRAGATKAGFRLRGGEWACLALAIALGGAVAPVLLMLGLRSTPAASASLLLNLESVLTALLAWFVFREGVGRRVALGMLSILAGAVALSWTPGLSFSVSAGPALIAGACLCWAADNNLTRKISGADPVGLAMLKGLAAGTVNTALAFAFGSPLPDPATALAVGAVGFLGYGVSLVLFVVALSRVGAARTGAYFAVAPFLGGSFAILAMGEAATGQFALAGLLMAFGVYLHLTERHDHMHEHPAMVHDHLHVHDLHHRHTHEEGVTEPHSHLHVHEPMRHKHPHFPDLHHLHSH